jgi:N-acetylornithine carbamoyltransferase
MEDDIYHPFQALADLLTVKEKFGGFSGVKFVMSWAYSPSVHKPRAVPQSVIVAATLMGCDTVLAHPPEMELDSEIIAECKANAAMNNSKFEISFDFEDSFNDAHVVYPKAWAALNHQLVKTTSRKPRKYSKNINPGE